MTEVPGWIRAIWNRVDDGLRHISKSAQRFLRVLRIAQVLVVIGILVVLASAVIGLLWPRWFFVAYALASLTQVLVLSLLLVIVALPLRARSLVRLIDKGYPGNARELAIRAVARKMRDQSIETEELLVETAVNEGRKVYERVKASAAERSAQEPPGQAGSTGQP